MNINQNQYNSPKGSPSPTHNKFNTKSNKNSSKKQTFNRKSKSIIQNENQSLIINKLNLTQNTYHNNNSRKKQKSDIKIQKFDQEN